MNMAWKTRQRSAYDRMWRDAYRRRLNMMGVPRWRQEWDAARSRVSARVKGFMLVSVFTISALLILISLASSAEVGMASVFYDRVVACPPYRINPYKTMGAAHKTLPCGTLVEVLNKLNGRRVTVPIVDLGPCTTAQCQRNAPRRVKKRIFDMLPMVARAIGSSGLTLVSLKVAESR